MIEVNEKNAMESARVLKEFLKEFDGAEVKVKPAMVKNNRCLALHYIDARCVMDRLDDVVGVDGWRDEYTVHPSGSVECRLSVQIAGVWVTKADVGSESEQPDAGDRMKAAYSDAFKRAAVKFGIGRFLYRMPQQWMDYDPVKKCIIRPQHKSAPQSQDDKGQKQSSRPPTAATDNLSLRAKHAQAYAQCANHDAYLKARSAVVGDIETGRLSQADIDTLLKADTETRKRCPATQPAKA